MQIDDTGCIVVLITASSPEEAKKISSALIDAGLAACANIVPSIQSIFKWQGNICDESESLVIAKTKLTLFESLKVKVKETHSYEVPEIIALPIVAGSEDYLKWIDDETENAEA